MFGYGRGIRILKKNTGLGEKPSHSALRRQGTLSHALQPGDFACWKRRLLTGASWTGPSQGLGPNPPTVKLKGVASWHPVSDVKKGLMPAWQSVLPGEGQPDCWVCGEPLSLARGD